MNSLNDSDKKESIIDRDTVKKIEWMARIALSPEEEELFRKQFEDILLWFSELASVNLEDVEPTYHVTKLSNVFRKDEVEECLPVEKVLQNVPFKKKGYIIGPKIL